MLRCFGQLKIHQKTVILAMPSPTRPFIVAFSESMRMQLFRRAFTQRLQPSLVNRTERYKEHLMNFGMKLLGQTERTRTKRRAPKTPQALRL